MHADRLEAIAEAIRNLSTDDRQQLLQMLGQAPKDNDV